MFLKITCWNNSGTGKLIGSLTVKLYTVRKRENKINICRFYIQKYIGINENSPESFGEDFPKKVSNFRFKNSILIWFVFPKYLFCLFCFDSL